MSTRGKILVIDDDAEFSKMAQMWLQNAGYEVLTAEDGVEGMRRVYSSRPTWCWWMGLCLRWTVGRSAAAYVT